MKKTENEIKSIGIDVETRHSKKLLGRLLRLKSTRFGFIQTYSFDPNYSQVIIETTKTEQQVDDWLYKIKHGCEYVGTFS